MTIIDLLMPLAHLQHAMCSHTGVPRHHHPGGQRTVVIDAIHMSTVIQDTILLHQIWTNTKCPDSPTTTYWEGLFQMQSV